MRAPSEIALSDDDGILRRWSARKTLARRRRVAGKTGRGGAAPTLDEAAPETAGPTDEPQPDVSRRVDLQDA